MNRHVHRRRALRAKEVKINFKLEGIYYVEKNCNSN